MLVQLNSGDDTSLAAVRLHVNQHQIVRTLLRGAANQRRMAEISRQCPFFYEARLCASMVFGGMRWRKGVLDRSSSVPVPHGTQTPNHG